MTVLDFHDPELGKGAEALTEDELNALPFGAIRLDPHGVVTVFNKTEAAKSGYKSRPALGLEFFLRVAPCMGKPEFKGRIEEARRLGTIDIEMGWIGDFDDADREMQVRIQSASDGGEWIFILRE